MQFCTLWWDNFVFKTLVTTSLWWFPFFFYKFPVCMYSIYLNRQKKHFIKKKIDFHKFLQEKLVMVPFCGNLVLKWIKNDKTISHRVALYSSSESPSLMLIPFTMHNDFWDSIHNVEMMEWRRLGVIWYSCTARGPLSHPTTVLAKFPYSEPCFYTPTNWGVLTLCHDQMKRGVAAK